MRKALDVVTNALGYTNHETQTEHGDVHFVRAKGHGRLPPIVLLHGLGSRGLDYFPVVRHLRGETRAVIAPDLLGHGRCGTPDVAHDVEALSSALSHSLAHALDEPAVVYGN